MAAAHRLVEEAISDPVDGAFMAAPKLQRIAHPKSPSPQLSNPTRRSVWRLQAAALSRQAMQTIIRA
jgi:hypothetical protein